MNARLPFVLLGAVLVIGIAATAATATGFERRASAANRELVEQKSLQLATDVAALVEADIAASSRMVALTEAQSLTVDEYRLMWSDSYSDFFQGESGASVFAAVQPDEVASLVAAMQKTVPDFEAGYLAEDPPEIGHFLTVFASELVMPFLGSDAAFIPHVASAFPAIGNGDLVLQSRFEAPDDEPAHIQIVRGHRILAADGVDRRAWTMIHVDLSPNLERMVADLGPQFGASLSTDVAGDLGRYGIAEDDSAVVDTATASPGDLNVDVRVWSDGTGAAGVEPGRVWVIGALLTAVATLLASFALMVAALLARANRSDQDARRDALTDLHNRRWLTENLRGRTTDVAVLFCDLDRFKVVNDSAGHTVGDELLLQVAQRLREATDGLGEVARWGGDEFVVLCETASDPLQAGMCAAERIVNALNQPFEISTGSLRVAISIGIATAAATDDLAGEELTRAADVALGRCKDQNGSGFVVYDESLKDDELDRLAFEADLQTALDDRDLLVYYQPLVDPDRNVISYEALVRLRRNDRVLEPQAFLPLAAEIGRMYDVDMIVLDHALETLAAASAGGRSGLTMHVNVDATDLIKPNFVSQVHASLSRHRIEPHRLVLELTEGEWLDEMDSIRPVLQRLSTLNVGLAIDDFGSGYSSLARMWTIPGLTELKLDRLMTESVSNGDTRKFLSGLIDGVQGLGLRVISEGVETTEQFRLLGQMGVTCFQGFLFDEPRPASAIDLDVVADRSTAQT